MTVYKLRRKWEGHDTTERNIQERGGRRAVNGALIRKGTIRAECDKTGKERNENGERNETKTGRDESRTRPERKLS